MNIQTKNLLAAALLGSALLASIGSAGAESIATGCLDQASGEIYNLKIYSNNTLAACDAGDQLVRLALQQPDTIFRKNRATIPFGTTQTLASFDAELGPVEVELRFDSVPIGGNPDAPTNACELYIFYDEVVYLLASTPPEVDGMSSVTIFHQDGRGHGETPQNTTGAVRALGPDPDWAVQVHDLTMQPRPDGCFASFLIEFANDPDALYSR